MIGCSVPAIVASDQPADGESPLDPPSRHAGVRVISVYATPWHILERAEAALPGERFRLHWLHGHFRRSAGQLPKVLGDVELDPSSMTFGHWGLADRMTGARLWLFAVPPGEVVVALDLGVRCGLAETGELLRDCYHLDVRIDGKTVESVAANVPALRRLKGDVQQEFFPERHQLAVTGPIPGATSEQVIQQVIHGTVSAHPHRSGRPRHPAELNQDTDTVAAVRAQVSVLCGQQDHVEDCAFMSAVQAVASAARLREIRFDAHTAVESFRREERAKLPAELRRRVLEQLTGRLSDLELDLCYSVESAVDLGMLVPSPDVTGFHDALFDAMELTTKADQVSLMLRRMEWVFHAELTTIQSIERRADDNRRRRWGVAIGFVSFVSIPAGLVLAFLGVNAAEVDVHRSIFDWHHYLPVYLLILSPVMIGALIFLVMYLLQRRQDDVR